VALEPGDPDVRALAERAGIAGFIEGSKHD
jgi:hypothetical protein